MVELAIVLANRSAVFYHIGEHQKALDNINAAFESGYPSSLYYKVYDRKARCLLALKQHKSAIEAFRCTLTTLDDAKLPLERRQKWQKDVQIMLAMLSKNPVKDGDYLEMQDLMIPKLFANDYDEGRVPDSLHVTLRPLLILAQCFALLPVHGVRAPNSKSVRPMQNIMEMIYFVYSFSYLVTRTCAVSLFAATIYDESKKPVSVLFSVPSECYCIEVQRFLTQVTTDDLALTGYRFFSVTRTLMLTSKAEPCETKACMKIEMQYHIQ
ncbi:uncharacterized protein LOC142331462 isoform X3 [Lycorma delicatula]|uniref:uncharacterized protein LOC142331462 isoform X3 n=1 Tax=Lycorma delicatula TaxID=130591 RepID=UPI003F511ADF